MEREGKMVFCFFGFFLLTVCVFLIRPLTHHQHVIFMWLVLLPSELKRYFYRIDVSIWSLTKLDCVTDNRPKFKGLSMNLAIQKPSIKPVMSITKELAVVLCFFGGEGGVTKEPTVYPVLSCNEITNFTRLYSSFTLWHHRIYRQTLKHFLIVKTWRTRKVMT